MARNEVYKNADYLSLPVATGKLSGEPVRVGGLNAVLTTNEGSVDKGANTYDKAASSNEPGFASVALKGAFRFPVSTTTALAIGDPVYITSTNVLTPVASGNSLFGYALSAKGTTANQPVIVRITN